ncbi:MAG: hypothetical protein ABFD08_11155, partial [Syntrophomonas sp.]
MEVSLGVFAGVIFMLYSIYFSKIITGKPEQFELEMLKSLANWMIERGSASRLQIWLMLLSSFILEIAYFLLVIYLIENQALLLFTFAFAGIEIVHIITLFISFYRFFAGKLILKNIFRWRLERVSAFLFFTHSFLVIMALWL